jgi:putative nucleotidyltransferase with HDIG domain
MPLVKKLRVDETKIKKAVLSGIPLTITTFTLPHEIEAYIEEVIFIFLRLARQEKLKDYIFYCIKELAGNAKKANTKRVYFAEYGLDISDTYDYWKGMKLFKKTTLENIAHYLQLQKEKGLYIKLILQVQENTIHIEIRNNATITRTELNRIHDRLASSQQYKDLDEAFSQVLDDSEGAGLGLVILALMLKKMGLDRDCFEIQSNDKETIARLIIPLNRIYVKDVSALSGAIVNSVNSLPPFPESILEIQRLIASEDTDMGVIARRLSTDPALTADLLRTANSTQYISAKRIDNIFEAVNMIGIRGIKNLLFSFGTQKILGSDSAERKLLWSHCYKTAFYAYNLVRNFKNDTNLIDDVYASGILHDMGKIVFSNVHPKLLDKIHYFCAQRNIPNSTFEDLSVGMNHAEIGAFIATKWNFPDNLIAAIRYHHTPALAPESCRTLVESIYLADIFCKYETGNIAFDRIEEGPLTSFGISSKKQLDDLLDRFSDGFKKL